MLINKTTQKRVREFKLNPFPSVLISGPEGSGKYYLARHLAAQVLGVAENQLDEQPYFYHLDRNPKKNEISIDQVREVIANLKLKTIGNSQMTKRIVIVENAHLLSPQAQNSLLKLLEEPPTDTIIILTATNKLSMLPTISSRLTEIVVLPATTEECIKYFGKSDEILESNWFLSGGLPGLMVALQEEGSNHPLKQSIDEFKKFISLNSYGRMAMMQVFEKDRQGLIRFLEAGIKILSALDKSSPGSPKRLAARKKLLACIEQLKVNVSPRLVVSWLGLNLRL